MIQFIEIVTVNIYGDLIKGLLRIILFCSLQMNRNFKDHGL